MQELDVTAEDVRDDGRPEAVVVLRRDRHALYQGALVGLWALAVLSMAARGLHTGEVARNAYGAGSLMAAVVAMVALGVGARSVRRGLRMLPAQGPRSPRRRWLTSIMVTLVFGSLLAMAMTQMLSDDGTRTPGKQPAEATEAVEHIEMLPLDGLDVRLPKGWEEGGQPGTYLYAGTDIADPDVPPQVTSIRGFRVDGEEFDVGSIRDFANGSADSTSEQVDEYRRIEVQGGPDVHGMLAWHHAFEFVDHETPLVGLQACLAKPGGDEAWVVDFMVHRDDWEAFAPRLEEVINGLELPE